MIPDDFTPTLEQVGAFVGAAFLVLAAGVAGVRWWRA